MNEKNLLPPGVTVIPTPPKQADSSETVEAYSEDGTVDILKTCHAFIERIDIGDGRKVFHEVEADVEKAGSLLFKAFGGSEEEKQSIKDALLASLCGDE